MKMKESACACNGNSIYRLPLIVLREEDGQFIMAEGKKHCTKAFVVLQQDESMSSSHFTTKIISWEKSSYGGNCSC